MGKRHHYLPRFYLKGFIDPSNEPYIWVYEKGSSRIKPITPENIAVEKHYYSLDKSSGVRDPKTVESALATIENEVAIILNRIFNQEILSNRDRAMIVLFTGLIAMRVPSAKSLMEKLLKKQAMKTSKRLAKKDKSFEDILSGRVEIHLNRNYYLIQMFEGAYEIGLELSKLRLLFLKSNDEYKYATFPNPFNRIYFVNEQPRYAAMPSPNRKSVWYLPLSRDWCLCMIDSQLEDTYSMATNEQIKNINKWLIARSTRFVFYSQNSTLFNKLVQRHIGKIPEY